LAFLIDAAVKPVAGREEVDEAGHLLLGSLRALFTIAQRRRASSR
jgi:hypothetical protein